MEGTIRDWQIRLSVERARRESGGRVDRDILEVLRRFTRNYDSRCNHALGTMKRAMYLGEDMSAAMDEIEWIRQESERILGPYPWLRYLTHGPALIEHEDGRPVTQEEVNAAADAVKGRVLELDSYLGILEDSASEDLRRLRLTPEERQAEDDEYERYLASLPEVAEDEEEEEEESEGSEEPTPE
jgi:hypothetical protein